MTDKVKDNLKESIDARKALYDFIDANPKGKGNAAYEYLIKRNIPSETAVNVVKEYGKSQEHHTGEPHEHEAKEEISGPSADTHMVAKKDEIPNTPIIDENDANKSKEYLNAYKGSLNTKEHMAEEEISTKPDELQADEQDETGKVVPSNHEDATNVSTEQDEDVVATNGNGNGEDATEDQPDVAPVNSSECAKGSSWDSTLRKCVPNDTGFAESPPNVVKDATAGKENRRGNSRNADIKSEKRRVAEYYRKLDKLEALRELKQADARIAAKEKFLKEKRLDGLIRGAKETAKPRASVVPRRSAHAGESVAPKKQYAIEAEVAGPVSWMKDVASEKNVTPAYVWHVNKQNIFETSDQRFVKEFDASDNAKYNAIPSQQLKASETIGGPAGDSFMRTMSEQVLVLPNGKVVTPIRQFCETKILAPGVKEAFFYDFGAVDFAAIVEDGSTQVGESAVTIRSSGGSAVARGSKLTIGYTQLEESPIDIISAANRSYALESVNDESKEVLRNAYNDDTAGSGSASAKKAKGGGVKTNRWVSHAGTQITSDGSGLGNLTFAGLVAAKGVIEDEGLDPSNLVTYTTGKAIRDLIFDPDLDSFISFSRPAIITEATVERIAGTNVVRSSAPADGTQSDSSRSVMFVPNIAFGLITGRDLTMEAQRRNELQTVFLTGTQRIAGFVKNVEATCRISHT